MNFSKRRFLCEEDSAVYDSATTCNALDIVAVFDVLPFPCALVVAATNADGNRPSLMIKYLPCKLGLISLSHPSKRFTTN